MLLLQPAIIKPYLFQCIAKHFVYPFEIITSLLIVGMPPEKRDQFYQILLLAWSELMLHSYHLCMFIQMQAQVKTVGNIAKEAIQAYGEILHQTRRFINPSMSSDA